MLDRTSKTHALFMIMFEEVLITEKHTLITHMI